MADDSVNVICKYQVVKEKSVQSLYVLQFRNNTVLDYILIYLQTSKISRTLVGNNIIDHSDVVGACRRCSNYIFIPGVTPGFNGSGKNNCQVSREAFEFWDLVPLIL